MIIAAFDVHYFQERRASAAAVLFHDYRDMEPAAEYTELLSGVADYVPGRFYRRELPCILALVGQFSELPDEMVIDGYVMLGDRPGLGQHLFETFHGKIPVIGVAKSKLAGVSGVEVFRGRSGRPLYITSAGVHIGQAAERIRAMHGDHRIPALLKRVDFLARLKAGQVVSDGSIRQ
ncbi:MAG: Endonuclease V [Syntrophorhabdus sp. PtaU1.Bin153]|nr:MAG: Endonuclease V [Syntrophorhabdus sp. PtaU1.Bin153]